MQPMPTTDNLSQAVRDLLSGAAPGLVTKEDLDRVHRRLDEIEDLVEEIEARVTAPRQ